MYKEIKKRLYTYNTKQKRQKSTLKPKQDTLQVYKKNKK